MLYEVRQRRRRRLLDQMRINQKTMVDDIMMTFKATKTQLRHITVHRYGH